LKIYAFIIKIYDLSDICNLSGICNKSNKSKICDGNGNLREFKKFEIWV